MSLAMTSLKEELCQLADNHYSNNTKEQFIEKFKLIIVPHLIERMKYLAKSGKYEYHFDNSILNKIGVLNLNQKDNKWLIICLQQFAEQNKCNFSAHHIRNAMGKHSCQFSFIWK